MDCKQRIARHAAIVVGLVLFSVITSAVIPARARSDAGTWLMELAPRKMQAPTECFCEVGATAQERDRLRSQLDLARKRADHHLTVAVYFFSNYYMAILQAFVMGALAAISLFFITKVGYAHANAYVITLFMTATALATIYGSFPAVFRQEDNVAENKALYLRYIALQNQMLSYAATGVGGEAGKVPAAEYIIRVDKELNQLNNIAIGFDASKLPSMSFELE